jgi:hypothetical protein
MHSITAEAKLSHLEALESESIHILRESRPSAAIRLCCFGRQRFALLLRLAEKAARQSCRRCSEKGGLYATDCDRLE